MVEEQELYGLVLAAVKEPRKNRMATLLFYQEQLSLQEVAAILGISVAAVKGRLYKSRRQLKAQLMPLYAEMNYAVSVKHRRNTMVKVTIADVSKRNTMVHKSTWLSYWMKQATGSCLSVGKWE